MLFAKPVDFVQVQVKHKNLVRKPIFFRFGAQMDDRAVIQTRVHAQIFSPLIARATSSPELKASS